MSVVVNKLEWSGTNGQLIIDGYVSKNDFPIKLEKDIRKTLIFINGNKKYYIPIQSKTSSMEYEKSVDNRVDEFSVCVDLSYIDNKDSLFPGEWELKVGLISNNIETECNIKVGKELGIPEPLQVINKGSKCYVKIEVVVKKGQLFLKSTKVKEGEVDLGYSPYRDLKKKVKVCLKDIKKIIVKEIYAFFKKKPIKENTILFLSDSRNDMSGNFKHVYDEIKSRGNNYDIKCFLNSTIKTRMSMVEKVKFLYLVATSKYIILDDYYPKIYGFNLREETELIQLWHACGAFKTFGFSRLGKEGGPTMRSSNHRNYTKAIVSSKEIRKHYAEGFGISEHKIYATGVPRTDIFFDENYKSEIKKTLLEKYPQLSGKKVIMFAPTFRGQGQDTAYYDFEKIDIEKLQKELGNDYILITKIHPFVKNKLQVKNEYKEFVLDLSCEREVNDLLFITDLLITDYSSVCFEFALLNRPMIFFAYDKDEYIAKRDFYYPYDSFVPGPIVSSTEEIIKVIKDEAFEIEKLTRFRKKFFDHFDGNSTKRVVDLILNEEKENK